MAKPKKSVYAPLPTPRQLNKSGQSAMQIALRLRKERGRFNLNALARRTGMSRFHIGQVWRGITGVSFVNGYRLAQAAGLTMEELYMIMMAPPDSIIRRLQREWETTRHQKMLDGKRRQKQIDAVRRVSNAYKQTPTSTITCARTEEDRADV